MAEFNCVHRNTVNLENSYSADAVNNLATIIVIHVIYFLVSLTIEVKSDHFVISLTLWRRLLQPYSLFAMLNVTTKD